MAHDAPRDDRRSGAARPGNARRSVVVAGGGPAGLALAAALGRRGVDVQVLRPLGARFRNGYGLFVDEAERLGLASCMIDPAHLARVVCAQGETRDLSGGYTRIDPGALEALLTARCADAGVRFVDGSAAAAEVDDEGATLRLEGGGVVRADLIVDTTGHDPKLVTRAAPARPAFQTAYGVTVTLDEDPLPEGRALLMDLSPVDDADMEPAGGAARAGATFLYALRLGTEIGRRRFLLEETSLVAAPAVPFEVLKARLVRRLHARGISVDVDETAAEDTERCSIPLGLPVPDLDQPVLGFGGAASLVHPATGYMVGRSLRLSDEVADAVMAAFAAGLSGPRVAPSAWRQLWTKERLEARRLQVFGMEVLLSLSAEEMRAFFRAFFAAADTSWRTYLDADSSAVALADVMIGMARHLDFGLVRRVATEALKRPSLLPRFGSRIHRLLFAPSGIQTPVPPSPAAATSLAGKEGP